MSHKHHNNNPFKNSENLDEDIKQEASENTEENSEKIIPNLMNCRKNMIH